MATETLQVVTRLTDHRIRLLLPFFLRRSNTLSGVIETLLGWTHEARKSWACWEKPAKIPFLYQDETLPSVRSFLFNEGNGCCAYLRVPNTTANYWFKNGGIFAKPTKTELLNATEQPTTFDVCLADPGIELFLSPHGSGVFSVTFAPKFHNDLQYIQQLNYRLSQIREFTVYHFRLPHSSLNENPAPALGAPLMERLGKSGAAFTLMEWTEFLLRPLQALSYQPMQRQFSVYSITRFSASTNFTDTNVQVVLRPLLTALVHVEDHHHPGSLEVCGQVLNPRYWAAVCSLGATHLVADQNDPPQDFDEQRLAVSLHKYFIPYLLSLMQRIALQGLLEEARYILISRCGDDDSDQSTAWIESLHKLNRHTLAFTVNGWFTEVSSREIVNQYYSLTQRGLRVRDSFQTVQRALRDAEVMDNDRFQNDTLGKMGEVATQANRSAAIVAHVQSKVEWLEVFFVSYYATALVYYLSHSHFLDENYANISLLCAPFVSGGIAFWKLRPDELHKYGEHKPEPSNKFGSHTREAEPTMRRSHGFLAISICAFLVWLGIGMSLHSFNAEHGMSSHPSQLSDSHSAPKQTDDTEPIPMPVLKTSPPLQAEKNKQSDGSVQKSE